jgi:hypothetical protein
MGPGMPGMALLKKCGTFLISLPKTKQILLGRQQIHHSQQGENGDDPK